MENQTFNLGESLLQKAKNLYMGLRTLGIIAFLNFQISTHVDRQHLTRCLFTFIQTLADITLGGLIPFRSRRPDLTDLYTARISKCYIIGYFHLYGSIHYAEINHLGKYYG